MRSSLISLTAGGSLLLLGAQLPGDAGSADAQAAPSAAAHRSQATHRVNEIAWFQGTIDEAFSHHGCRDHRRRTLFRL